ncbi:MAG: leucine-rich repeat domain-containing protein [Candidatus Sigynarchaeota archaeon]
MADHPPGTREKATTAEQQGKVKRIVEGVLDARPGASRGVVTRAVRDAKRAGDIELTNSRIAAAIDRVYAEREEARARALREADEASKAREARSTFRVNEHLSLRLVDPAIVQVLVDDKPVDVCKHVIVTIPADAEGDSIDELVDAARAAGTVDGEMGRDGPVIPPETAFWAHCSNVQAWADHDYDTRLIDSRLAFPLLRKLAAAGDAAARRALGREIDSRLAAGYWPTIIAILETVPGNLEGRHLSTIFARLATPAARHLLIDEGILDHAGEHVVPDDDDPGHVHLPEPLHRAFLDHLAGEAIDVHARFRIARHPRTSPATLERLARDQDRHVRRAVALNPGTPRHVIAALAASDPDPLVRRAATRRPRYDRPDMQKLPRSRHGDDIPFVTIRGSKDPVYVNIEWASQHDYHHEMPENDYITRVALDLRHLGIRSLDDIGGLDTIPRLDELDLSNNQIAILDGFSIMPWITSLKSLTITSIDRVTNLAHMVSLETLHIDSDSIKSIKDIGNLILLKSLFIKGPIEKIEDLENLCYLESLTIRSGNLRRIEGLNTLSNLIYLDLSDNQITCISNLENLKNLQTINLANNKIVKIEGIDGLENLRTINLVRNPIPNVDVFKALIKSNVQNVDDALNFPKARAHYMKLFRQSGIEVSPWVVNKMESLLEFGPELDVQLF